MLKKIVSKKIYKIVYVCYRIVAGSQPTCSVIFDADIFFKLIIFSEKKYEYLDFEYTNSYIYILTHIINKYILESV